MAAQPLLEQGRQVVLHARNQERDRIAMAAVPGAVAVVTGDLAGIAQTRIVADQANALPETMTAAPREVAGPRRREQFAASSPTRIGRT